MVMRCGERKAVFADIFDVSVSIWGGVKLMVLSSYIFISGSSKDAHLINLIEYNFQENRINKEPFFASRFISGTNPADKIIEAFKKSRALFMIITPNVINDTNTLNWVLFETGLAKGRGLPVYGWKANSVTKVPQPIEYVTDYAVFEEDSEEDILRIIGVMMELALKL